MELKGKESVISIICQSGACQSMSWPNGTNIVTHGYLLIYREIIQSTPNQIRLRLGLVSITFISNLAA